LLQENVSKENLKAFTQHYRQIERTDFNSELLFYVKGYIELSAGQIYTSLITAEKGIAKYPKNVSFYSLLLSVLPIANSIGIQHSIESFKRKAPDEILSSESLQKDFIEYYIFTKQYKLALNTINMLMEKVEKSPSKYFLLMDKARILLYQYEIESAKDVVEELLRIEKLEIYQYVSIGELCFRCKFLDQAEQAFKRTLEMKTTYESLYYLLAIGKESKRESEYSMYAAAFMENYEYMFTEEDFFLLGWYIFLSEKYDVAELYFTNAITCDEKNDEFYHLRSICRFKLDNQMGAIEDITSAMTLAPNRLKYFKQRIAFKEDMGLYESVALDVEEMNHRFKLNPD
jgi:tetratricopeptide (TPR) repeat protein